MTVVLEVRGFNVTEAGEVVDAPLDTTNIHVKLSTMSFRIPPRGTYTVFYEVTATTTPELSPAATPLDPTRRAWALS